MAIPLEAAIVRIRKTDKRVVGAEALSTDTLVLICAHVVAQALGILLSCQRVLSSYVS